MKIERITWNLNGFRQIRKSAGVAGDLSKRAQAIASGLPRGYIAVSGKSPNRARAAVIAASRKARKDPNKLLTAIDLGR